MKRSITYPDWAEKYRSKGRTIRKTSSGYALYECTSVYVKDQKYPKSVQTYLGKITEEDGFIPKRITLSSKRTYMEYGLSHFILSNFKRGLERSINGGSREVLYLGIILYLFGDINEVFIRSTYISRGIEDTLIQRFNSGLSKNRFKAVANKIETLLKESIPDESDRNILVKLLFLSVLDNEAEPESFSPPSAVTEIIERYGLRS